VADWQINFGWTSSNQKTDSAAVREIKTNSDAFARMIVNQVAVAAGKKVYTEARRALQRSVRKEVQREIGRMAMNIARSTTVPDKRTGPYGPMSLFGSDTLSEDGDSIRVSDTYLNTFGRQFTGFKRQDSKIKWSKRTDKYMRRKQRDGFGGSWFKRTGELEDYLGNLGSDEYEAAFGPVTVLFTRLPSAATEGARLTNTSAKGQVSSKTVAVGRLEVLVFNRITPAMMPGLATMDYRSNPQPGVGAAQLLSGDQAVKLQAGKQSRPAIDPFVSFYLTRAIPNAVWRRTERVVKDSARRTSFSGKGSDFGGV
jgi:hypothetical protein